MRNDWCAIQGFEASWHSADREHGINQLIRKVDSGMGCEDSLFLVYLDPYFVRQGEGGEEAVACGLDFFLLGSNTNKES